MIIIYLQWGGRGQKYQKWVMSFMDKAVQQNILLLHVTFFLYLVSVQSIILLINNSKSLIEVFLETFLRSCLFGIWQLLQDF